MLAWLLAHWLSLAGVGTAALAIAFPAVSGPIFRFLLLTERGRYLLLAGIVACSFRWWTTHCIAEGRAAAVADQARETARTQQVAHQQAIKRDTQSDAATAEARKSADTRLADHNQRAARVEGIAREPRPPVPAVCPGPDPRLTRELQDGGGRLRAAEGRLRSLGTSAGGGAD